MRSPSSVILPALTLSISYFSTYLRLIRSEMIKTSKENWVKFARARCLPDRFIIRRILLNSLRGTASGLGMSIPKLMAGAFVVENIFAWPGLGRLCVTAIFNRDFPVIQAYIVIMACLFILLIWLQIYLWHGWIRERERIWKVKNEKTFSETLPRQPQQNLYSFLLLVFVLGVAAPFLPLQNPEEIDFGQKYLLPSADHWLGTDQLGRDLFHGSSGDQKYRIYRRHHNGPDLLHRCDVRRCLRNTQRSRG